MSSCINFLKSNYSCVFRNSPRKGDYARTRAIDSKHLPALILGIF